MRFDFLPRSGFSIHGRTRSRVERCQLLALSSIDFVDAITYVLAIIGRPDLPQCPRCCLETGSLGDRRRGRTRLVAAFVIFVVVLRAQVHVYLARCGLDKTFTVPRNQSRTDELSSSENAPQVFAETVSFQL